MVGWAVHGALPGQDPSFGRWEVLLLLERQLIKIPSLENDQTVFDVKKSTAAKPERIRPFQNGPLTILKDVLDLADHSCPFKFTGKHLPYCRFPHNRLLDHLMIDGVFRIEGRQPIGIGTVERFHPFSNEFARFHTPIFRYGYVMLPNQPVAAPGIV